MKVRKILHLTLVKRWFNEILERTKKFEYRDIKPYWTKRLFDDDWTAKEFDVIVFKNGYSKDAPMMKVEFKGVKTNEKTGSYEILLGKVLEE